MPPEIYYNHRYISAVCRQCLAVNRQHAGGPTAGNSFSLNCRSPGSGKGTQSPIIKEEYWLVPLATGDMLRAAVAAKLLLALKLKKLWRSYIDDLQGELVSDDLVLDDMLAKQGTKIDKVLNFAIDDAILERRITGRVVHPSTGRTYHSNLHLRRYYDPLHPFFQVTGEPLIQRKDDTAAVLKSRLETFHKQTEPETVVGINIEWGLLWPVYQKIVVNSITSLLWPFLLMICL
ncbi:Adenylate kinase B [Dendrobium catenatum]|uniref:adenylate kinase n=1 Tax=Dendrobium catenatum TaxID=906689 RepID=A0A2I0VG57_9ASPA|nr:Adenylate kinase B [Dendrobium catenatum]